MKLLTFFPSTGRGGCEEYALSIARGVLDAGWWVEACFPQLPTNQSLLADFTDLEIRCHCWRASEFGSGDDWGSFDAQRKEARGHLDWIQPDVVHVSLPWPDSALGFIVACGGQSVATLVSFQLCHETIAMEERLIEACALARSRRQRWTTVSRHNRRHVCESFKTSVREVDVINNGADIESRWSEISKADRASVCRDVRQELRLPDTATIALTVARLARQKGHYDLLAIARQVIYAFPSLFFVWAGHGEESEVLRAAIRAAGLQERVLLLGYRRDVARLLCAADLFLLPSHHEGFPFALVEAMACGCPVVASDCSGVPECIEHNKEGLLYPPGNVRRLCEALTYALSRPDLAASFASKARERAQLYTARRMRAATLSALARVAAAAPA